MPVSSHALGVAETASVEADANMVPVKGKVVNEQGEPLIGVNVRVKGTSTGTITDMNGRFKLTLPRDGRLVFSYIGYQELEQTVKIKANLTWC